MHLLLAAALIAAPAAQADPFCGEIGRLAAGAKEAAPFETMFKADEASRLLERPCFRTSPRAWFCNQSLLPPEIGHDSMAKRIAACLPGMAISPGEPWPGLHRTIVKGAGLVFELEESGGERAHVGRILSIEIRADR